MCTSASGRSRPHSAATTHASAGLPNPVTRLPALLQTCVSSMLAGEYSVFKVPAGVDDEWDDAMQATGRACSVHYVQMAMLHFQRRGPCCDKSTAAVTIVRHSNLWSFRGASLNVQSPAVSSTSIDDGSVIKISYAARCTYSSQWFDVAISRNVSVGGVDLPIGLDAAVRSMQVAELCDVYCSGEDAYAAEAPAGGVPEGIDVRADVVFRCAICCF